MASSAAGLSDQHLFTHSLASSRLAHETSNSSCGNISPSAGNLPRAGTWLADSVEAASLQQPASSTWQLTRHLSTGNAEALTEASQAVSGHPEPPSFNSEQQQSIGDRQPLSPQQENQNAGSPSWHFEQGQHRHRRSAQHQSAGILGDVSNVISVPEQGAKRPPKQIPLPGLQPAAILVEGNNSGDPKGPSCCPPDTSASTEAVDSRADNTEQQHDLGQADYLLREWYTRCAVCSLTYGHVSCAGACKRLF